MFTFASHYPFINNKKVELGLSKRKPFRTPKTGIYGGGTPAYFWILAYFCYLIC